MTLVSILLPVYNGEKTLENTIKSLLLQTYKNFELLIALDGCTDRSEAIVASIVDERIRLFKFNTNRGLGPTLNRLMYHVAEDSHFIALAEQDDYYYTERIEKQVKFLKDNAAYGLVSGIAEFWNGKTCTKFPGLLVHGGQYPQGKKMFLYTYREQIKVVNSSIMFRKTVHIDNGMYFSCHFPSVSVDWSYILRFSLISRIYGLQDVLVRIDRRPYRNSVTSNKDKQFLAARELLRSFKYEFPEIVREQDFKYAMNTQYLLELSHSGGLKSIRFIIFNPVRLLTDSRYIKYLFNMIKMKYHRKWSK